MNPVPVMKLVEVIRGLQTSYHTLATTQEYIFFLTADWPPKWASKHQPPETSRASLPTDCSCHTSTKPSTRYTKESAPKKTSTRLWSLGPMFRWVRWRWLILSGLILVCTLCKFFTGILVTQSIDPVRCWLTMLMLGIWVRRLEEGSMNTLNEMICEEWIFCSICKFHIYEKNQFL